MSWKLVAGVILGVLVLLVGGVVAMVKMDPTSKVRSANEKLWKTPEGKLKYPGSTELERGAGSSVSGGSGEIFLRFGTDDDDEKVLAFYSESLTAMGWARMKRGDSKGPNVRDLGWWTKQNFVFILDATSFEEDGGVSDARFKSVVMMTLAERTYFGPPRKRR